MRILVGGGFAGLSAAYILMKRGITPLLLEAGERAGGRGKGDRVDRFSLDMGAFFFTSTYDTASGCAKSWDCRSGAASLLSGWWPPCP
ncbi:MAG: NAD(P)-binding protein [Chloroflexi bacterium]|nr:NAD(P)-binding protein [Chloroflexota bacterium]